MHQSESNVNVLVAKGKYNECNIIHNKLITLYVFHKSCPFESRVLFYNNSTKRMIKIFLESFLKTAIMWGELITQPTEMGYMLAVRV